jgi:glycosyltransferase involved in cell wall biosynthesis
MASSGTNEGLRIAAVWSREHTGAVGRSPTVRSILRAMHRLGPIEEHVLSTVLERRAIGPIGRAGAWAAGTALRGRPLSLQTVLFADGAKNRELATTLAQADPDVVYLDGVRTYPLFLALKQQARVRRIVVDFDDLMSRRMAEFGSTGVVPLGYVGKSLPGWVRAIASPQALGKAVLAYERGMLEKVEQAMTRDSDGVSLVSSADADLLRRGLSAAAQAKIHVIPPCMDVERPVAPTDGPLRFVFLGSDRQSQNRLTIEYLVKIWESARPGVPLVIAGPMVQTWPAVENVTFTGWLEDTSVLYTPGSIMITPSFIRGGIKTKVLQAFAYGCPAVGNDATFEGLPLEGYPFRFNTDDQLRAFLADLPRMGPRLREAAEFGQCVLREHFSREGFDRAWKRVLSGVD